MDYDFITTCNWTSTGTFTLQAYLGSGTDVVTSYSLFYRKKGDTEWTETTNGQVVIASTGEWEIANDWNKSGNNVLHHSYFGITAINSCTDVYFDEDALGATVGDSFLRSCWRSCTSLTSMPVGFNLPSGITTVGANFLSACWYGCSSLTSMPVGFNIPSGITSVGDYFLYTCWQSCTKLASMPVGFNLPSGITTVGANFLSACWYNCTNLKANGYTENITFEFNATSVFAGTCPLEPNSVTASKETPVNVAVNRQLGPMALKTWNGISKATIKTINGVATIGIKSWNEVV